MADGVFVSGLPSAATLTPSTDLLYLVQPAQSPKSRKITAQTLMAGPTAEARKASYYIYTVDTGSGTTLGLSMEPDRNMSVRFSGSAAFTTVQVPDGEYDGQIVAITNDRSTSLTVQAVTPSTLHKTIVLGNGESCTLTWEGSGSWRADSASPALAAEVASRALIGKTEVYDATVTGDGYARDVGGSGVDATATTATLRISKITAKAWMLQVEMVFPDTTIISGSPISWTMHASSVSGTGALIDDLRAALLGVGPVMFGQTSWVSPGPDTKADSLTIALEMPATHLRFTPARGYLWAAQTGAATVDQMSLRASGMVILP